MNKKLEELLKKTNSNFSFDEENKTWCLSGTDKGNYWETDDQEALTVDQAESDAIDYLLENNA